MSKTVLIGRDGTVDNVIKLVPGEPYDPDPGVTMLTVPEDTFVGPGMVLVEGSKPPTFTQPPEVAVDDKPDNIADAIEAVEAAQAQVATAIDNLKSLQG